MALPQVRVTNAAGDQFLDFNKGNLVGSNLFKLASCDWMRIGQDIGGRYDFEIVPGSIDEGPKTANVRMTARNTGSPSIVCTSNPNTHAIDGSQKIYPVVLDGATHYRGTILRDVDIVFNDLATSGIVDTSTGFFTLGDFLGSFADGNPSGSPPGSPVYGPVRRGLLNTGGTLVEAVTVIASLPHILYWPMAAQGGFDYVKIVLAGAVEKEDVGTLQTLPYRVTFANVNTGTNRIDLLVDGDFIEVLRDLDASPTDTSPSEQILRNRRYLVESGGLTGTEFKVSAGIGNAAKSNLTVWETRAGEVAPDHSGDYDEEEFDTADFLVGNLVPSELGHYWIQADANIGSGQKNPMPVGHGLSWLNTGVAAIEAP